MTKTSQLYLGVMLLTLGACVVGPGYYDAGPGPAPGGYGYYGAPGYAWNSGVDVDIIGGYGHGGYDHRGGYYGHGGGRQVGVRGGGGGFHGGGGGHGGGHH